MTYSKVLVAALFSLFMTTKANAAVVVNPTFFYSEETDTDSGNEGTTKLTMYDFKLGYMLGDKLYLGFIYAHETKDNVTSEAEITALGASLGYFQMGWYFLGHYFFDTERSSGGTKETGTSGVQADLGYLFSMGSISLGPQITYKKYEFDKLAGATIDRSKERVIPMLSFAIQF